MSPSVIGQGRAWYDAHSGGIPTRIGRDLYHVTRRELVQGDDIVYKVLPAQPDVVRADLSPVSAQIPCVGGGSEVPEVAAPHMHCQPHQLFQLTPSSFSASLARSPLPPLELFRSQHHRVATVCGGDHPDGLACARKRKYGQQTRVLSSKPPFVLLPNILADLVGWAADEVACAPFSTASLQTGREGFPFIRLSRNLFRELPAR
jgi:hypothetical protein